MKTPLITIVIPTSNRPIDLGKCLRSLVAQCHNKNIEILVCDDSKDFQSQSMVEREFPAAKWN